MNGARSSRVLRTLTRDKAFYFFTSIGNYAGESAASLEEFVKKILDVSIKSLEFHLYRGDFERWIAGTLEDSALANKIEQLKTLKPIGIDLRDRLYLLVSKHCENLKTPRTTSSTLPKPAKIIFSRPESNTVETQIKDTES
ncbi:MAG: hypothetical protein JSV51_09505 [Candidatus Bathyarchaeota archaeon]|nr:MAG: hypothetical protein JSV51_09505 [Candidatus Bathyarchaeota archaeon]